MITDGGSVTFGDVTIFCGAAVGLLTLWWRVETRVSAGAKDAMNKAQQVEAALNDYKLDVAENYAKNGFIRDVENRLGARFDAIVAELHGLRTDFQKAMVDMANNNNNKPRR